MPSRPAFADAPVQAPASWLARLPAARAVLAAETLYDDPARSLQTEQTSRSIILSKPAREVLMKVYKPEWQCTFSVNEGVEEAASWKERIAWLLRGFADRLDSGGRTFKIDYRVTPQVSRQEVDTCLGKGFEVTQGLLTQLAHQAACEDVMRHAKAELFEEPQQR
jgi:hypothetical protein